MNVIHNLDSQRSIKHWLQNILEHTESAWHTHRPNTLRISSWLADLLAHLPIKGQDLHLLHLLLSHVTSTSWLITANRCRTFTWQPTTKIDWAELSWIIGSTHWFNLIVSSLQRTLDILKIDVEGAEWPALRNLILEDTKELMSVKQLIMEIHSPLLKGHPLKKRHLFEIIYYFKELRKLGFLVFKSFQTNSCCLRFSPFMSRGIPEKCCHEASFINSRYFWLASGWLTNEFVCWLWLNLRF